MDWRLADGAVRGGGLLLGGAGRLRAVRSLGLLRGPCGWLPAQVAWRLWLLTVCCDCTAAVAAAAVWPLWLLADCCGRGCLAAG